MSWRLVVTKQANKDAKKIAANGLRSKVEHLLDVLRKNPYQKPPRYEKLIGDLTGLYSSRINIQHRLIYQVLQQEQVVKIVRMWTHYD